MLSSPEPKKKVMSRDDVFDEVVRKYAPHIYVSSIPYASFMVSSTTSICLEVLSYLLVQYVSYYFSYSVCLLFICTDNRTI